MKKLSIIIGLMLLSYMTIAQSINRIEGDTIKLQKSASKPAVVQVNGVMKINGDTVATKNFVLTNGFNPSLPYKISADWGFSRGFYVGDESSGTGFKIYRDNNTSCIGDWQNGNNGTLLTVDDNNLLIKIKAVNGITLNNILLPSKKFVTDTATVQNSLNLGNIWSDDGSNLYANASRGISTGGWHISSNGTFVLGNYHIRGTIDGDMSMRDITAKSVKINGGDSSHFLMADGSTSTGGSSFDTSKNETITGNWQFKGDFNVGDGWSATGLWIDKTYGNTSIGDRGYGAGTQLVVADGAEGDVKKVLIYADALEGWNLNPDPTDQEFVPTKGWSISSNGVFTGSAHYADVAGDAYSAYSLGTTWSDNGTNLTTNGALRGISTDYWNISSNGYFTGIASNADNATNAGNANYLGGIWNDDGNYFANNGNSRGISTANWSIDQSGSFTGYASTSGNADFAGYAYYAGNATYASYLGTWNDDGTYLSSSGNSRGIQTPNWNINSDGSASFAGGGVNITPNGHIAGGTYDGTNNSWWIGQDGQTRIGNALPTYKKTNSDGDIIEQTFESIGANKSIIKADIDGTFSLGMIIVDDNPTNDADGDGNVVHNYVNTPVITSDVYGDVNFNGGASFSNNLVKTNNYENYGKIELWNTASGYYLYIRGDDGAITLGNEYDGDQAQLDLSRLSSHRGFAFPDQTGIFALTSDLGTYKTGTVSLNTSHYIELKLADGNTYKVLVAN